MGSGIVTIIDQFTEKDREAALWMLLSFFVQGENFPCLIPHCFNVYGWRYVVSYTDILTVKQYR